MIVPALRPRNDGRLFVIGDIHGRLDKLESLIKKCKVTDDDTVIFVGDYIDRGPQSKEVLDYVMGMCEDGVAQALQGNHELMALYAYQDDRYHDIWSERYGKETLESFGTYHIRNVPTKYIEWFISLPLVIRYKQYYISHAGIDYELSNPLEDTPDNRTKILFRLNAKPHPTGKYISIIGHCTRSIEFIETSTRTNLIHLDGGCGKMATGKLVAYCITTNRLYYV